MNSIICADNTFVDFNTEGNVVIMFNMSHNIENLSISSMLYTVAHFYNHKTGRKGGETKKVDDRHIVMASYDYVAI